MQTRQGLMALGAAILLPLFLGCRHERCELLTLGANSCSAFTLIAARDAPLGKTCTAIAGCQWGMRCDAALCSTKVSRSDCKKFAHCEWSDGGTACAAADASVPLCNRDAATCISEAGCVYSWRCFGTPADCGGYMDAPHCGADPHCSWHQGPSPYQLGLQRLRETASRVALLWQRASSESISLSHEDP